MLVQEEQVNTTEGYRFGESGMYEPWTDNIGLLFKAYQREFGKCISKVYIDIDNTTKAIGWVFRKTAHYDDTKGPFTMETWVTLHDNQPERTIKYNYHFL